MSASTTGSRRLARIGLIVVLPALLAGGCTSWFSPREAEAARVFLLAPSMPVAPRRDPRGPSILVGRPRAASGFTGAQMMYIDRPYQLDQFALHRWADAPANMPEPLVAEKLEASGLFRHVVVAGARVKTELRLDMELLRLVQVFAEGQSRVELAMRVTLVDTRDSRLIDSRVLAVDEPAAEPNPYAGVAAANRAVARLLGELQDFLGQSVRKR